MTRRSIANDQAIVLFDGVCIFCNGAVNWTIGRDKRGYFRFAPLQSSVGEELQKQYGLDPSALSNVVIESGKVYKRSAAGLRIVRRLPWPWPALYALIAVPRPARDFLYDWFARNRYRWFGKREECMVPSPEVRERFLGDGGSESEAPPGSVAL